MTNYREPLRTFGISAKNALYIWVQHIQSDWWHEERGRGPFPVEGALLQIPVPDGRYAVLLWDTCKGEAVRRLLLRAERGKLTFSLPKFERDVAVAVLREQFCKHRKARSVMSGKGSCDIRAFEG